MPLFLWTSQSYKHVQAQHRVLVVGTGSIMDDGLEGLLRRVKGLSVMNMVYTNRSALLDTACRFQPDTIVLNESAPLSSAEVFMLLNEATMFTRLRIIVIRLENNFIDLYEKRRITASHHDNLVTMICGAD